MGKRVELLRALRYGGTWRVGLPAVVLAVGAVMPSLFAIATGALVAAVPGAVAEGWDAPEGRRLVFAVSAVAALLLFDRVYWPANEVVRSIVSRRIDGALRRRVLDL